MLALQLKGNYERSGLNVQPKRTKKETKEERVEIVDLLNAVLVNTSWKDSKMFTYELFYSKHKSKLSDDPEVVGN